MKKNRFSLSVVLILFLTCGTALAQPRSNPLERARHHMELGNEAFAQREFSDAADQFISAYAASPFPAFLFNAAFAFERDENYERSIEMYSKYLKEAPNARDFAEVEVKIRAMTAAAQTPVEPGEKAPGIPEIAIVETEMKSLISVRANPGDAKIRILDSKGNAISEIKGETAATVERGMYTVEASHPDYRTVQTDISVIPGQVYIVVVEMSQGAFLGFLHLKTDIPGAHVFVDKKELGAVGTTPWGNVLPTGEHRVWIEKPGYKPIEELVKLGLGEQKELEFKLVRLGFGRLNIKSNIPGSKVIVNDNFLGAAPVNAKLTPGRYKVIVSSEGMKDYKITVKVFKGQTTKLLVRMNPKPKRTSAWVSMGVSAGMFIVGGITGYKAYKTRNALEHDLNNGRLSNEDPRILKGFLFGLIADLTMGVGTIVGSLSIYYFLRDRLPPSEGKLFDPVDFGNTEYEPDSDAVDEPAGEPKDTYKILPVGSSQSEKAVPVELQGSVESAPAMENSVEPAPAGEEKTVEPDVPQTVHTPREQTSRLQLMISPYLSPSAYGLGMGFVF